MPEKQTRRRGEVLERAILDAGWEHLREHGWAGFTVEGVAARSGAAKSVIYRRWSGRVELAQDMLGRAAASAAADRPLASRGELRQDLVAFLVGVGEFLRGPFGDAVRGVVCEGDRLSAYSLFGGEVIFGALGGLLAEARARGELQGEPSVLTLNLAHAVVMSEFLHTGAPPDTVQVTEFVDAIWLPALLRSPAAVAT